MKLSTFEINSSSPDKFIRYWAKLYIDKHEEYYSNNIDINMTPESVGKLFWWKNGGNLSKTKKKSLEDNFIAKIDEVNDLSKETPPKEFLNIFPRGGAIWRIFFLHIWQPRKYPIYDQHVHRAMTFLRCGEKKEIPLKDRDKITTYLSDYIYFHAQFQDDGNRSVDKALWTFGRFLKSPFGKILGT